MLPFEFIVTGSPVSLPTNNRTLLQNWKAKVRQAALDRLPRILAIVINSIALKHPTQSNCGILSAFMCVYLYSSAVNF